MAQQLIPDAQKTKRILAYELLLSNGTIKAHLMANQLSEIQNTLIAGKRQGMIAMDTHLFELYQSNTIDHETLTRYCHDLEYVKRLEKTVK